MTDADAGSGRATDPINASVDVRNGDGTDELEASDENAANTFAVTGTGGPRFTIAVNGTRDAGYYTFDGNEPATRPATNRPQSVG